MLAGCNAAHEHLNASPTPRVRLFVAGRAGGFGGVPRLGRALAVLASV